MACSQDLSTSYIKRDDFSISQEYKYKTGIFIPSSAFIALLRECVPVCVLRRGRKYLIHIKAF